MGTEDFRSKLLGFFDAVDAEGPQEYDGEPPGRPSSLQHVDQLIAMRGLIVTQAAELELGLRSLLPLLETLSAKPSKGRITGLGSALAAVTRCIAEVGAAGLLPGYEAIQAQLDSIAGVREIRNRAAHATIRTGYTHDGIEWVPVVALYGDDLEPELEELGSHLAQLREGTRLVAHVYWRLRELSEPSVADDYPNEE